MDRYNLVRLLGKGAAGAVYLAEDKLLGGRKVALKRIKAGVDELLRAAFEREFATMASLSLPGVARVFDFGVAEGDGEQMGGPFFTRSFIDGSPLDIAALALSPPDRVRLIAQVAEIVAPLHRVGVVHGDIKPGNVIIDPRGQAYVIDFGLSRFLDEHRGGGASGGTPSFMAPELLQGGASSMQADIYALGVTLWTVLIGADPFGGLGRSSVSAKLEGLLPALPERCDAVTAAALRVALRAMARDPLDRFPTVGELLVSLDQIASPARERESRRGFVAPRPRGHEALLFSLESQVSKIANPTGGSGPSSVLLVHSATGGGKSNLLRELKWRLQLRSFQVLEIAAHPGDTVAPLLSLVQQALVVADADREAARAARNALKEIRGGRLEVTRTSDALASLFERAGNKGPVVVLADDLDNAEGLVGEILRSAIHAETGRAIAVVAAAANRDAPAVRELHAGEVLPIPPLNRQQTEALAADALGPVDNSVIDALCKHTRGLPATLVDALSALAAHSAPTAADVLALPVGQAGLSIARSRLRAAPAYSMPLLRLLAVAGASLPRELLRGALEAIGEPGQDEAQLVTVCEDAGLAVGGSEGIALADRALAQTLLEEMGAHEVRSAAAKISASEALARQMPLVLRARLAVAAEDVASIRRLAPRAGRELAALGAHGAAIEMYQAVLDRAESDLARDTMVSLARLRHITGEHEAAAELARRVLSDGEASASQRVEAAVTAAQALRALARFDQAIEVLSLISDISDNKAIARVQRELAQVHIRRGDYDAVAAAAAAGLTRAPKDDLVRVELLTSLGLVASYRGHHEAARVHYQEALLLARQVGSKRDQANALSCLAVGHQRASEYAAAGDLFAQSLAIARELGDMGSMATFSLNLGAMRFMLGEPARAAEHYEAAAKLARRAGRISTHSLARNNLALLHIYFGFYERARVELAEVLRESEAAGLKYVAAQATAALGDLAARTGDVDSALRQYDQAIARYAELGQNREAAEAHLDAADALLDRDGVADASAAAARLAAARGHIDREKLDDFRLRLDLLLARARNSSGDAQGAIAQLENVLKAARAANNREIEWRALAAAAAAHESQGADFMARRYDRMAVEVLEKIALSIPREHREAFWHDARRREARRRATLAGESTQQSASGGDSGVRDAFDPRGRRLLEIIKRLAGEHDLDRLLERITESAVDLSGAERGLVLLVDGSGKLETKTVSTAAGDKHDSHVAFSRSIAEAVLIDGEPIVSVDAADDKRLREYLSVHQLMLRSVACLPIQGRSGVVGVLYLEHRRRRGRFRESDVELLVAFADQAAIALENARLIADNKNKREELEKVNAELSKARQDMEDLLIARTEALDESRRELERARRQASEKYLRHGMVGRSAPMQRLFDAIDRVRNISVPLLIHGESGTGKDLTARAIHYGGPQANAPFITLNCASIPEALLESELFGHVKGAFTGADRDRAGLIARASGGTLLLDEVGEMPAKMQVDLLRVLQEGVVRPVGSDQETRVQVRFIATSCVPLSRLVGLGKFREDLYYRLGVVDIGLPPLRERREDIPLLCEHFLQGFARRDERPAKRLSAEAVARLCNYPWPGNVRQLEHLLLNAWAMVEGGVIQASDLFLESSSAARRTGAAAAGPRAGRRFSKAPKGDQPSANASGAADVSGFQDEEKAEILRALEENGWNKVRAAQQLGMPRRTFYRRLQQYGIA